MFLYMLTAV